MSSASSSTSSTIAPSLSLIHTAHTVPASLKFLIAGLKTIVSTQLSPENYLICKSQVTKLFTANGYFGYLDGTLIQPPAFITTPDNPQTPNPDATLWLLVDQNLSAALLSTISSPLLPHLLHLPTCHDVWITIHHRLQPTNRSRLTQLKHQLYNLSMKDQTMMQYLSTVKSHINAMTIAGSHLDTDNIIHYILNGLPSSYHSFKTSIQTNLQPLSLDDFYSLFCSEEANLAHETHRELLAASAPVLPKLALNTQLTSRRVDHSPPSLATTTLLLPPPTENPPTIASLPYLSTVKFAANQVNLPTDAGTVAIAPISQTHCKRFSQAIFNGPPIGYLTLARPLISRLTPGSSINPNHTTVTNKSPSAMRIIYRLQAPAMAF